MKRLLSTTFCAGLALAAVAAPLVAEEKTLSAVEVKTDLSAFENSNALEFWPTLSEDIGQAIASELTIDDQSKEPRIVVSINKVAINGETTLPDTGEFNQLEGTVTMFPARGADNSETSNSSSATGSYALKVSATSGEVDVPENWIVIPPSQDDFYEALTNAYAMEVVERIED
ncbi:hypothetical protein SAMN05444398_11123 [Roseovarius pacificus]|uniref:Polyketide cyclase / dehydrase and lipid transport n=1 Tax=Roseovarius pacificus TaxID=337701 RepID=A0A1M7GPM9_9RHOB|nr:hypothetical protein [Roseovarius pacificus]GGO60364.1 hypothetical protein GCM10011315_34650 [Roseovarius pacificus]SHM17827.1 hypothetical protein SAMN05444398_11123 [Roseovarius pacificus]